MDQRTEFEDTETGVLIGYFHWGTIIRMLPSLEKEGPKLAKLGADLDDEFQLTKVRFEDGYHFMARQWQGRGKNTKYLYATAKEQELKEIREVG